MPSSPFRMIHTWTSQNSANEIQMPTCIPLQAGHTAAISVFSATAPIQV